MKDQNKDLDHFAEWSWSIFNSFQTLDYSSMITHVMHAIFLIDGLDMKYAAADTNNTIANQ